MRHPIDLRILGEIIGDLLIEIDRLQVPARDEIIGSKMEYATSASGDPGQAAKAANCSAAETKRTRYVYRGLDDLGVGAGLVSAPFGSGISPAAARQIRSGGLCLTGSSAPSLVHRELAPTDFPIIHLLRHAF